MFKIWEVKHLIGGNRLTYLCVCLVLLSVESLLYVIRTRTAPTYITKQFTNRCSTDKSTKHTHKDVSFVPPIKCLTSHILNTMNLEEFILTEQLYCKWYTQTATYHVNIQRMQISGRHYTNGTKHDIYFPENGRIKRTETCRCLFVFTKMCLIF
jgi:hypothetical protein